MQRRVDKFSHYITLGVPFDADEVEIKKVNDLWPSLSPEHTHTPPLIRHL